MVDGGIFAGEVLRERCYSYPQNIPSGSRSLERHQPQCDVKYSKETVHPCPVCPLFYSFSEILTPLPFLSRNSGVISKEVAIVSGLVGDAKDRVQTELDGRTGDTDSELSA